MSTIQSILTNFANVCDETVETNNRFPKAINFAGKMGEMIGTIKLNDINGLEVIQLATDHLSDLISDIAFERLYILADQINRLNSNDKKLLASTFVHLATFLKSTKSVKTIYNALEIFVKKDSSSNLNNNSKDSQYVEGDVLSILSPDTASLSYEELKNPETYIKGMLELMRRKLGQSLNPISINEILQNTLDYFEIIWHEETSEPLLAYNLSDSFERQNIPVEIQPILIEISKKIYISGKKYLEIHQILNMSHNLQNHAANMTEKDREHWEKNLKEWEQAIENGMHSTKVGDSFQEKSRFLRSNSENFITNQLLLGSFNDSQPSLNLNDYFEDDQDSINSLRSLITSESFNDILQEILEINLPSQTMSSEKANSAVPTINKYLGSPEMKWNALLADIKTNNYENLKDSLKIHKERYPAPQLYDLINRKDSTGVNLLYYAIVYKRIEMLKLFAEYGIELNPSSSDSNDQAICEYLGKLPILDQEEIVLTLLQLGRFPKEKIKDFNLSCTTDEAEIRTEVSKVWIERGALIGRSFVIENPNHISTFLNILKSIQYPLIIGCQLNYRPLLNESEVIRSNIYNRIKENSISNLKGLKTRILTLRKSNSIEAFKFSAKTFYQIAGNMMMRTIYLKADPKVAKFCVDALEILYKDFAPQLATISLKHLLLAHFWKEELRANFNGEEQRKEKNEYIQFWKDFLLSSHQLNNWFRTIAKTS